MMNKVKRWLAPRRTPRQAATVPSAAVPAAVSRSVVPAPVIPVLTIDALGRKCPIPIIMLADRIREVAVGDVVAVLADDPAAYTDVPAWCTMKSHEFAGYADLPRGWALYIRRGY